MTAPEFQTAMADAIAELKPLMKRFAKVGTPDDLFELNVFVNAVAIVAVACGESPDNVCQYVQKAHLFYTRAQLQGGS